MTPDTRRLLLLAGAIAGYALMMAANPVRSSLRDGLRCVGRYKQIFFVPACFGVGHAVFQCVVRWYESVIVPHASSAIQPWSGWQAPPWPEVAAASGLPTLESVAAIFNCIVTVFPLSAPVALLFLCNWRGYQAVLLRGLARRWGWLAGLVIHPGLIVCAVAAMAKPFLFLGGLPRLNEYFGGDFLLAAGEIVNWLSFIFEYMLGVGVQIYLVLLSFAWIRGLTFDFIELRRFALRRFVFVVKWAVVVIALSSIGIDLPLIIASFHPVTPGPEPIGATAFQVARGLLAVVLLLFCSMQITLIFHNESFRRALRDHRRFLRLHWPRVLWLAIIASVHFFLLAAADGFLERALGGGTLPAQIWALFVQPPLWAALGGWFLASWVCLFRRCETNRPDAEELVRF